MAKKKIKRKIGRQLKRFLSDDGKLSRKELRKISNKAKQIGFTGSNKKLAKIISKKSQRISPEARKTDVKTNKRRLQTMSQGTGRDFYNTQNSNAELLSFTPGVKEVAEQTPQVLKPEPPAPPPEPEDPVVPEVGQALDRDKPPTPPTPELPGIDFTALLSGLMSQPQQTASTTAEMPEPEESLGRAKATSTYLSGGSAGGIRRRRSNRSKLGLSGLGTNQLSRNVSNLLSIRGISV